MSRKTETKSFGSVVRQSHNSKKFYSSKLFEEFELPKNIEYLENRIPEGGLTTEPNDFVSVFLDKLRPLQEI